MCNRARDDGIGKYDDMNDIGGATRYRRDNATAELEIRERVMTGVVRLLFVELGRLKRGKRRGVQQSWVPRI